MVCGIAIIDRDWKVGDRQYPVVYGYNYGVDVATDDPANMVLCVKVAGKPSATVAEEYARERLVLRIRRMMDVDFDC